MSKHYSEADNIKHSILSDNLNFNLYQQSLKAHQKNLEKLKSLEQDQYVNRRISTEINEEKKKQMNKKVSIQNLLARQYQRQIMQKRFNQQQQRKLSLNYAKLEQDRQNSYEEKRSRELARIYRGQKSVSSQISNPQNFIQPQTKVVLPSRLSTEQPSVDRSPKSYNQYLNEQILKRQQKRQKERAQQKAREQQMIQKYRQELNKQQNQSKKIKIQQQLMFKKGLDEQISQKRDFKFYH